jgi:hypothetical protein
MPRLEKRATVVIGSGQASGPLSMALARAGQSTALVERAHVGGAWVNEGCTPTKTMIASALVGYLAPRDRGKTTRWKNAHNLSEHSCYQHRNTSPHPPTSWTGGGRRVGFHLHHGAGRSSPALADNRGGMLAWNLARCLIALGAGQPLSSVMINCYPVKMPTWQRKLPHPAEQPVGVR